MKSKQLNLISPEEREAAKQQWLDVEEYLKGMKDVGNNIYQENLKEELEKNKSSPELEEADKQMEFFENMGKEGNGSKC